MAIAVLIAWWTLGHCSDDSSHPAPVSERFVGGAPEGSGRKRLLAVYAVSKIFKISEVVVPFGRRRGGSVRRHCSLLRLVILSLRRSPLALKNKDDQRM